MVDCVVCRHWSKPLKGARARALKSLRNSWSVPDLSHACFISRGLHENASSS